MPDTHQTVAVRNTCTCDECIDGWLAPRMKERLEGRCLSLHDVRV